MPAAIALASGKVACAQEMVGQKTSPLISVTLKGKRVNEHEPEHPYDFGAAPALLRAPDDRVILAFHTGYRKPPAPPEAPVPWMFTNVWLLRGNAEAEDFGPATQPWPALKEREGMFFPSLFMKDENTIVVLGSHISQPSGRDSTRTTVRWIEGKLNAATRKQP